MENALLDALRMEETDVDGALYRLAGNEPLYLKLLTLFPADPTIVTLQTALEDAKWDDAFTAAHVLKGLAGNLGFMPLFHSIGALVIYIREGRIQEIGGAFHRVQQDYSNITFIIDKYLIPDRRIAT